MVGEDMEGGGEGVREGGGEVRRGAAAFVRSLIWLMVVKPLAGETNAVL